MKASRVLPLVLLASLWLAGAQPMRAQSGGEYDLTWNTIDAGGAIASTGGDHELAGTIGQPDASSAATTGVYSLVGGFWQPVEYLAYMPIVLRGP
jgi:hypothetical protein